MVAVGVREEEEEEGGGGSGRKTLRVNCCFYLWEGGESGKCGEGSRHFSMDAIHIEMMPPPV